MKVTLEGLIALTVHHVLTDVALNFDRRVWYHLWLTVRRNDGFVRMTAHTQYEKGQNSNSQQSASCPDDQHDVTSQLNVTQNIYVYILYKL